RHDAEIKIPRGQDVELMFQEGGRLFARAAVVPGRNAAERSRLARVARRLTDRTILVEDRLELVRHPQVEYLLELRPLREHLTHSEWFPLIVHRERALFGSWYEFFPRSEGVSYDPMGRRGPQSGTFRTAMKRLPAVAEMGFDVVYLPPI